MKSNDNIERLASSLALKPRLNLGNSRENGEEKRAAILEHCYAQLRLASTTTATNDVHVIFSGA